MALHFFSVFLLSSHLRSSLSQSSQRPLCEPDYCQEGYECDIDEDNGPFCVATSCSAEGACQPWEGCVEVTCIRAPCPVLCSPCPVHTCLPPPQNPECTAVRRSVLDEETGCEIYPCPTYDCPDGNHCLPPTPCAAPPEGCRYVQLEAIDAYGCPPVGCGELRCEEPPCPVVRCAAPPAGCRYVDDTSCGGSACLYDNGCPMHPCGLVECDEPPPPRCREGFVYQECGSACPTTCGNHCDTEPRPCTMQCVADCFCARGTILDEATGACVLPQECSNVVECAANEVSFDGCGCMNKCDAIACDPAPDSCWSNPCDCNRETGDFNEPVPIADGEPCFWPSSPEKVCINGECVRGRDCAPLECDLHCPHGFEQDDHGCDMCRCHECGPVCMLACEFGNVLDEHGCPLCECLPAPPTCPVVRCAAPPAGCRYVKDTSCGGSACLYDNGCPMHPCGLVECVPCEPLVCDMDCPYGLQQDENGCDMCRCHECGPICSMACEYGFVLNERGCPICECQAPPPSPRPLKCVSQADCGECQACQEGYCRFTEYTFQQDCNQCTCMQDDQTGQAFAQCTEMVCPSCDEGATVLSKDGCNTCVCNCGEDEQKCDLACTQIFCVDEERECAGKSSCPEYCEFGFRSDQNGCPTCECIPAEEVCSRVRCRQPVCTDGQRAVKAGCCSECEDIKLAGEGENGGCNVESLAQSQERQSNDDATFFYLQVRAHCSVDTIQAQLDTVLRATVIGASEPRVELFAQAYCCYDAALRILMMAQARPGETSKTDLSEKAVENLQAALLDPASQLRSELRADPELKVLDAFDLRGGVESGPAPYEDGTNDSGLSDSARTALVVFGVVVAVLLVLGFASHQRAMLVKVNSDPEGTEGGGETMEGVAMGIPVDAGTELHPSAFSTQSTPMKSNGPADNVAVVHDSTHTHSLNTDADTSV